MTGSPAAGQGSKNTKRPAVRYFLDKLSKIELNYNIFYK